MGATGEESERNSCSDLREELRVKKFWLDHDNPSLFVIPQCVPPRFFLPWSVFWLVFHVSMLMLDIYYNKDEGGEWFIYLTNLSYLFLTVTVVMDATVTLHVHINRPDIKTGLSTDSPWYVKVLWAMYNIINTVGLLVTVLYYALLTPLFHHASINKHLLNSVYILLNLVFSAKPVRLLHFYQPMIYAFIYLIFTVIYHAADTEPIYGVLDWSNAGFSALTTVLVIFVAVPICHLFCFAVYTFRVFVYNKCCAERSKHVEDRGTKMDLSTQDVKIHPVAVGDRDG